MNNMKQNEIEKKATDLKEDLYYDLLEKYVALKAEYENIRYNNTRLKYELREFQLKYPEVGKQIANSFKNLMRVIKGIIIKNKTDYHSTVNNILRIEKTDIVEEDTHDQLLKLKDHV
jgi:hypothetical protein